MTDPFAAPAPPSDGIDWSAHNGQLLLINVGDSETVNTSFGEKEAVRADVVILDGPDAGTRHDDTLVFPKLLVSQLKPRAGQKVLGRLGQGQAKPGQKPPWILAEATPADKQIGVAYLANGIATPATAVNGGKPPF
jgi:hypothetical protein